MSTVIPGIPIMVPYFSCNVLSGRHQVLGHGLDQPVEASNKFSSYLVLIFFIFLCAFGEIKPLISLSVTPAIDCNQPIVVNAASVLLTSPGMTTLFLSTAAVTCKTGFSANGVNGTITCGANRMWTGISCIGEMIKLIRCINFLLLGLTKQQTQHFLCGTCYLHCSQLLFLFLVRSHVNTVLFLSTMLCLS